VVIQSKGTATVSDFPVDCVVVFGAAVHSRDDPGPGILRRTQTAAQLYRSGDVQTIILAGGKGRTIQDSEAAVMRKVAMLNGVAPEHIKTEDRSENTWENLRNTLPLTEGCQSVLAVSDGYHLARIASFARRQGWGMPFHTYPASPKPPLMFQTLSVLREALALIYYAYIEPYSGGIAFMRTLGTTHVLRDYVN
ncbi:MAG: YdcF family protein, partial [Candidatus Peribacteraceae bacterium]|nr:YdcF family protein [Candidatus Peribacteraceae bacterium]